ncbi:glycosyltransferase family 4 protein [Kovacikia minuta CCNUW1]|uniref:glycosyltransferase family 4 protein n=1 Tax=Kovacikia minuta TaxID=2931930 RepID=UPI001CCD40D8|nr:glycosyltransferase family 1 protein [Kovacikia minuta]UBF24687.1 glycosyltransferase family 4 protein [Kovacikia minuta CCNUW1]
MKVAYDISLLGTGYINPKSRTGIFRVAEALFLELGLQKPIDLFAVPLNEQSSIWDSISAKYYFQALHPELESHFCSIYSSNSHLERLYQSVIKLQRTLIQNSIQTKPFSYKLALTLRLPFDWLAAWDGNLQFDRTSYDVYHSVYYALPDRKILGNLPRILTIHDLIPVLYPEWMSTKKTRQFQRILNSIDRDRDWIICNSQHTKQDFCHYTGMDDDRVFVTPLAVASFFQPVTDTTLIAETSQRYHIPDRPYLLSLATLEPRKNLAFLIRCFSELINDDPTLDLNLVLVGVSGWKNSEIFDAARQNPQLSSRIIFTGYLPDEDLSAIYSGATAFVYPSLYEGFGLPPLEAMQCGTTRHHFQYKLPTRSGWGCWNFD